MTFLAHWRIDEGAGADPTTAIDSAAGGSGSHDGTYNLSSSYGRLGPGGVGGHHLRVINNAGGGQITGIGNPGDLRLLGYLTVMFWYQRDNYYYADTRKIINCTGTEDVTAAENDLWDVRIVDRTVQVRWETAPGTRVTITSTTILPKGGWAHIAVVRYEVTAGMFGIKFYVDGVLVNTQDNSGVGWSPPVDGGNSLPMIGRDGYANDNRECYVDSLRVYDTAESDANILAVYNAEKWMDDLDTNDGNIPSDRLAREITYGAVETGPNNPRVGAGFSVMA